MLLINQKIKTIVEKLTKYGFKTIYTRFTFNQLLLKIFCEMKNEKINVVAEKITFYQFSNFLQKLSLLPTLEKKKRYLNEFILEWKRFGSENVKYTNEEVGKFQKICYKKGVFH